MSEDVKNILDQRGDRYGKFENMAAFAQAFKMLFRQCLQVRGKQLEPWKMEALEMVLHKLSRIINGDDNYLDSYVDIMGYVQLIIDKIEEENNKTNDQSNNATSDQ